MSRDALIGYTGFVGSHLLRQHEFAETYRSTNIESIIGESFDRIVCSGMPAAKWIANRDPVADRAVLDRLLGCLKQAHAKQVVVISTVDVYPQTEGADETTPLIPEQQQPYGHHRYLLECGVREHFPNVAVIRLPALFGAGLKKNAIYDLLNNNETHKIHALGSFQFYNLEHLGADLECVLTAGLELVNFAVPPLTIQEIAREAFGIDFTNDPGTPPARYDVRSVHASALWGHPHYLATREEVLAEMKQFVEAERRGVQS